jgi:hypothetical protein
MTEVQRSATAEPAGWSIDRLLPAAVRDGALAVLLWIIAATFLSELTTRSFDWFAKDDELRYQQLAISIAKTHSLVPRIHGVNIGSYSQLYPLLIAPFFRHGTVPENVHTVHLANAWIMSSACIPAFFLARRVTGRMWAACLTAGLTVVMPWIVLSTMMMTEVASYPASVWALYAMQRATASPSRRNDLFAVAMIVLAYLARGELLGLMVVFPIAVIGYEVRGGERSVGRLLRRHDLLAAVCVVFFVAALALRVTGELSRFAGIYGRYAKHEELLPHGIAGSFVEHLATFSLAFGVLPFVGGVAWMLANAARGRASGERFAFAWVGSVTVAVVMFQSTNFDVLYNTFVHDRFLPYLVPVIVISVLCATIDVSPLRWSLCLPAVLVALGFTFGAIPRSTWGEFEPIDADSPLAAVYRPLVHAFGTLTWARVGLVLFTLLGSALLLVAGRVWPRLRVAAVLSGMLVIALVSTTTYVFTRYFGTNDWASRPVTNPQVEQYAWIDQTVGRNANVTMATYPLTMDWFINFRIWRDYQYWNASLDRDVELPRGAFTYSSFWFPKVYWHFDPTTGRADVSLTRYVLEADQESRFRISGKEITNQQGLNLIDADQPWRTDWLSSGLYDDGWTRPGVTTRVRVFAQPNQRGPILRGITFGIRAPGGVASRRVELSSNQGVVHAVASQDTGFEGIQVCVPAHGYADVLLRASGSSTIPGDQSTLASSLRPRTGGVFLTEIALADELGGPCKLPTGR